MKLKCVSNLIDSLDTPILTPTYVDIATLPQQPTEESRKNQKGIQEEDSEKGSNEEKGGSEIINEPYLTRSRHKTLSPLSKIHPYKVQPNCMHRLEKTTNDSHSTYTHYTMLPIIKRYL